MVDTIEESERGIEEEVQEEEKEVVEEEVRHLDSIRLGDKIQ